MKNKKKYTQTSRSFEKISIFAVIIIYVGSKPLNKIKVSIYFYAYNQKRHTPFRPK